MKLINILKEQTSPFDRLGIQAPVPTPEREASQNKTEPKSDPVPVSVKPKGSGGTKITDGQFTEFKNRLAIELGIKLTPERNRFFDAWRAAENTNATFNPFATSWPGMGKTTWNLDPGMTVFNYTDRQPHKAMVKTYSTLDLGVDATAKTIRQSYYTNLFTAMKDDSKTAEDIAKAGIDELQKWGSTGSDADRILNLLKRIAPPGQEKTYVDPGAEGELQSIITMNSEEADAHFWEIITTWAEAEYQFWNNTGTGPEGVKNPQTHDDMFEQFQDFWDDKEPLAQKQYRNTRKPALAWLLKQLNKYQDIQEFVKEYGSINVIFQAKEPRKPTFAPSYRVPRQTPPWAINRVTWYLSVFNWINEIADTITDYFQTDCEVALEWAEGGDFFRRSVQAEIDPIGSSTGIPADKDAAVKSATYIN